MRVLLVLSIMVMAIGFGKTTRAASYDEANFYEADYDAALAAAMVSCTGEYAGYKFSLHATVNEGRLASSIRLTVIDPDGKKMSSHFRVISSAIHPHKMIRFSGKNETASGSLEATYDPASGDYIGTLDAHSTKGDAAVPVICSLKL